eukprot:TRINITY_DN18907_c0_g1_i3.p1 TRINITY_DN18907_c0_g1~~TRINITY_DN18907_c0_g1_i3.p1  ORF type:complete len:718 (+),score=137.67 TRINITY_DN18907_c0_g1_i3:213-2366(+)
MLLSVVRPPRAVRGIWHQTAVHRFCAAAAQEPARIQFDPSSILPHEMGDVRIISNTTRDAQQSNCSAEMAHEHRQEITKLIDGCYEPTTSSGQAPGYEQVWGGTVPMFDIWKRAQNPFDSLRQQVAHLPHTPTSMLFRSNAGNSMSNLPYDVLDAFIKQSAQAGMNVYTNFDAHNDPRNHRAVAESVLKHGAHYQAALSWAVFNPDPSIYNVQWAVDFFRECVAMGAHSLYVKDPSGVLTPEMAACLTRQVKEAFPELPLVFHTHYQTGYGYMTYLEAVKAGANGIECSLGFPDGAGQPYSLTMLRVFEDLGYNTGDPSKAAMHELSEFCKKMRPLYPQANLMRTPDIGVESSGIAGGQRSILDKELRDVGQPQLIPEIDKEVLNVRTEGGKVCQVTPVADTYAREAMRRLRGGDADKEFVAGYAGILVGEGGLVKEPVCPSKQERALFERAQDLGLQLVDQGAITGPAAMAVKANNSDFIYELVHTMQHFARPIMIQQRHVEVTSRISQLQLISEDALLLASLDRKFDLFRRNQPSGSEACASTADKLTELRTELTELEAASEHANSTTDASMLPVLSQHEYEVLLRGTAESPHAQAVLESIPRAAEFVREGHMSAVGFSKLVARAGYVTCPQSDLLPPAMHISRKAIEDLEDAELLGMRESTLLQEDLSILHACYNKAAIPNMYLNFLRNYREDLKFWPSLYTCLLYTSPSPRDS